MEDFLLTVRMLDPLLLWCLYFIIIAAGVYVIVITHPRVKSPKNEVYYNSRRDDNVSPTPHWAPEPTDERD